MNNLSYHILALILLCTSCTTLPHKETNAPLSRVYLVDNNGFSETIQTKERLATMKKMDFLKPQPYQKVLRSFQRKDDGASFSIITTYYPHGQIKQYLEAVDASAHGFYKEWHPNGVLKLTVSVIGGVGDITPSAEMTWIFDGLSKAWNDGGALIAEIPYSHGELNGISRRYYSSGTLREETPYHHSYIHGTAKSFLADGSLLSTVEFSKGKRDGISIHYGPDKHVAMHEVYDDGLLISGQFFDRHGTLASEIVNGNGFRSLFKGNTLVEKHEYRNGVPEGVVLFFNVRGEAIRTYSVKNGLKNGEEIEFFAHITPPTPKLSIWWTEGVIQGIVKTWYDNGVMESSRQMSMNKKNGISTAWFLDGSLMLIEEFQDESLIRGEYHKKGIKYPVSKVVDGNGEATLYDGQGNFLKKITYVSGYPLGG